MLICYVMLYEMIIACSFVTSRLDYVNSVLYGISAKIIHRLQRMQNTLARVVLGSSAAKFSHSIDYAALSALATC